MTEDRDRSAWGPGTKAIHAGRLPQNVFGEVSTPIFQSSTFAFPSAEVGAARFSGEQPGYIYTRLGNPTVSALEAGVAALEQGEFGIAAASGMAAISTTLLSLLRQGEHVVAGNCLYGPTEVLIEAELSRFGIGATMVDTTDLAAVEQAVTADTRLIYIETPTNPTMTLTDIAGAAEIARRRDLLLAVDNTFASPYLQRPLELGAHVVIHSLTKYINGHSDVVGGLVVVREAGLARAIKRTFTLLGGVMDPHQAWLILRGLNTLPLRLTRAQANAMALAGFLQQHPRVAWVRYPGLPGHPQHDLARRQMDGFGAMLCFGVKGGLEAGRRLMNRVRLITLAVSLGGVESLIEHPASMTHAGMSRESRERAGITDELVRLSVGCEDLADLQADLDQALQSG